ncbi:hypothetical protein Tsubulata_050164 [Turnera subulata]|uniref:Exopolygalacturonase n=1 Tax=Turnera subulata TaxID=218843 RepID=A0A9Q0EZN6_9ROSI|nr:hypothetical protein Tsubulata_050164 [Turnera subulata]
MTTQAYSADFDVRTFGAKADGKTDDTKSAWMKACAADTPSKVVIGSWDYMVGSLSFEGPCKNKVTVHLEGTFKAPEDPKQLQNSQNGWVIFRNVDGLNVLGGGTLDGQGALAWSQNNCATTGKCNSIANVVFASLTNSRIQELTSRDSKFFHMTIMNCKNLTLQGIKTASILTESTLADHWSRYKNRGRLCFDRQSVEIEDVTCGSGHGISIGSLGRYHDEQPVYGITVRNATITGTSNGVRIKTWPASPSGIASNVHFEDITMKNVSNPVLIDQEYCPYGRCQAKMPSRVKISNLSFKRIHATSATQVAVKLACSRAIPCSNVSVEDVYLT